MKVEIDVDELCSLRADLRALMEENTDLASGKFKGGIHPDQIPRAVKRLMEANEGLAKVNGLLREENNGLKICLNQRRDMILDVANDWEEV